MAVLKVKLGSVPRRLDGCVHCTPCLQFCPQAALMEMPFVARYLVERDGVVTAQPYPGVLREEVVAVGSRWLPSLLELLNGNFSLRGSAVLVEGRATVLVGPSAIGASTLAAALAVRGCPLIADMVVPFVLDRPSTVRASEPSVDLWPDAAGVLELDLYSGKLMRRALAKRSFTLDVGPVKPAVPVGRLVWLRLAGHSPPSATASLTKVSSIQAMAAVLSNQLYAGAVAGLGLSGRHFEWMTQLACLDNYELPRVGGDLSRALLHRSAEAVLAA